jgi:predicted KAP-like P-loop ATPase
MTSPKTIFLSDHETATDLLYYEAIAGTIVKFIQQSPSIPLTIGVHGDWGAGKSSILKMVAKAFDDKDKTLCIWFNGWTFEGFENAKTVVIETLVTELKRARPTSTKVADAAKKVLRRIDWLKVAQKAGGLALTATTGIPSPEIVGTLVAATKSFIAKPQDHIDADDIKGILDTATGFLKETEAGESVPEQVHKFREEFAELLAAADLDQLVVLIDDLDRCLPETAISTLEAIRLFLHVPKTAFVVAADEAMIEYSVRRHFPELPSPAAGTTSYARSYLEKLIQVPFRVPALGLAETRAYITLLLSGAALGEDDSQFKKLLAAAREDLRRPWESSGLDRKAVKKALATEIPTEIEQALKVSEQITRQLTEGTRGNPRQIKRFLNSMMLRKAIAVERGFGDDIHVPVLAKIMLAERFLPDFYEYLSRTAASDSKGRVTILEKLDSSTKANAEKKSAAKASEKANEDAPELDQWANSAAVKIWAAIEPALKEIDLRPYIFVARDKRSYFTGAVVADHLEALATRLLGTSMAIRQVDPDISHLGLSESEQIFDILKERILSAENLATAPAGVAGIALLVKKHVPLQRRLLSFLRDIPTNTAGAWAATSWAGCFSEATFITEFNTILDTWGTSTTNSSLKAASRAARQMKAAG